jgi:CRISPR-associated endonuclease Cas1
VNHNMRRLVVIGSDGMISLTAVRWLADQGAAFVMLERDGRVLAATGPTAPSDVRLRRAQARLDSSEAAVEIARELIRLKLEGQEAVAREKLGNAEAAASIAAHRAGLADARDVAKVRFIESLGGSAYWSAWRDRVVEFPRRDAQAVPDHWKLFGSRNSPVSAAPRKACNPGNAMLNFLYTMLEAETRLTAVALGLDPGFGLIHVDSPIRDSLVYDLMEPIRPKVGAILFDWLTRSPLKREWFFEQWDGTCRLMPYIVAQLAEASTVLQPEIAPIAEWFAKAVTASSGVPKLAGPRSRLTRSEWRTARFSTDAQPKTPMPKPFEPQSVCKTCGVTVTKGKRYCKKCAVAVSSTAIIEGAKLGRVKAVSPEAMQKRRESSRRQNEALQSWNPADLPAWLTNEVFMTQVRPRLQGYTRPAIAAATSLTIVYAGKIRNGNCVPHQRHWLPLAKLVGIEPRDQEC